MRATLGAAAVDVQARFAGDLLHVMELNVARADRVYQVGLSATAELPLPLPPLALLRVVDDQLELCVPDFMRARSDGARPLADGAHVGAHETVVVTWAEVEIAIVPAAPARGLSRARSGPWLLELLSSGAATMVGLIALFPAALLLLVHGAHSWDYERTLPAHIEYTWRDLPTEAAAHQAAAPPALPVRAHAKRRARTGLAPELEDRSSSGAAAHARDDDIGLVGPAARRIAARQAAARAGLVGLLDGQARFDSAGNFDLQGMSTGDAEDSGGLGLVGSGTGGGGVGEGTIGLGSLGALTVCRRLWNGSCHSDGLDKRVASAPDVIPGTAQVRGGLDKELIRRIIRRHLAEVRFCYERALVQAPELTGRVSVHFMIHPDGAVVASAVEDSTLPNPAVGTCTAAAFLRWEFPRARHGGVTVVSYPFVFVPAGHRP